MDKQQLISSVLRNNVKIPQNEALCILERLIENLPEGEHKTAHEYAKLYSHFLKLTPKIKAFLTDGEWLWSIINHKELRGNIRYIIKTEKITCSTNGHALFGFYNPGDATNFEPGFYDMRFNKIDYDGKAPSVDRLVTDAMDCPKNRIHCVADNDQVKIGADYYYKLENGLGVNRLYYLKAQRTLGSYNTYLAENKTKIVMISKNHFAIIMTAKV